MTETVMKNALTIGNIYRFKKKKKSKPMSNLTFLGKIQDPSASNINMNFFLRRKEVMAEIFNLL